MISLFLVLKIVHVIGATVLLGTGAGIAFFMLMAHRTNDAQFIAQTASIVVIADTVFTASAVVIQPLTGLMLTMLAGYPIFSGWVGASLILYLITGACWLPVVAIQIKLRDLAREAANDGMPLPPRYHRLFKLWFLLGFPAFAAVMAIIGLMVVKP